MGVRPAAGGGRWVDVDPERLAGWLDRFRERHGSLAVDFDGERLRVAAFDGTIAQLAPPPGAPAREDIAGFLQSVGEPRTLGLLLVRRGGTAVGVAAGDRLLTSKITVGYVQSRAAAGGWSQQRFARRRENQARAAAGGAADLAVRLLLPEMARLSALVTGGDRGMVDATLADRRLASLTMKLSDRFLDVSDPRHAVLVDALRRARMVRILLTDPAE